MKISRLALAGDGGWSDLAVDRLSQQANIIHGRARSGKSTVAQLVAQLLYGRTGSAWRREFGQTTPLVEGSLTIDVPHGGYVLRRHRDGSPTGRLTVAADHGAAVDSRTVQRLLGDASPRLLAQLYAVDFAEGPRVEELFAPDFARDFNALLKADDGESRCTDHRPDASTIRAQPNSRQLDALAARRDQVTEQLESRLAGRRRQSGDLQRQLAELEASLGQRRTRREQLLGELHRLQAELAGVTMRLRYFALEAAARRTAPGEHEKLQSQIEQLDAEIGRCRQTLADLQQREAVVRRELAESQSAGAASDVDSLADQRATLGVIERLLDDLDAETAQLARAVESDSRYDADAHARLSPVADMLRQQAYALCGQITEQERAFRRMQLQAEARQLTRAQTDLSEQLEQLLGQRQGLLHRMRLESQPVVLYPDAPADEHCRCEHHGRFVVDSEAMLLGRGDRVRGHDEARRAADELQQRMETLRGQIVEVDGEIAAGERQWNDWQRSRAGLLDAESVAQLKAELDEIESQIARHLACDCERPAAPPVDGWRASDVLAKLTDGRLVQVRGRHGDKPGEVVDRDGRTRSFEQLTPGERDQTYLAVTLALVASHAARGTHLPLVLDEPFLRQDAAAAAAMAGVLASFAASGRQTLVFTEDREAVRRFTSLGANLYAMDELRQQRSAIEPTQPAPVVDEVATTRVVRETVDETGPQLRVTGVWPASDAEQTVYYLTEDASMADFPVLGNDTASRFARLGIRTAGDLLRADPQAIADGLKHPTATAAVVALWQTHMRLMCFVPGVSLNDAQLLAACGIETPKQLADADLGELVALADAFLDSSRGTRFVSARKRYERNQFRTWQRAAADEIDRWRRSGAYSAWRTHRAAAPRIRQFTGAGQGEARRSPRTQQSDRTERKEIQRDTPRRTRRSEQTRSTRPLRFFLETSSPVVDAPSIGEKTSALLVEAGIRTVADLLACDPVSVADELSDRRITHEKLVAWQQQARLVCRIPELRGYGAQLLVACGFTEPKRISGADPTELARTITAYCRTKEGQRILRNSPAPTAAKVARWIERAAQRRSLDAA
ncbi:MAG: DUF4332 domain-containing protein [Planctomycetales bacterium]|nr:DUF4332 domain-containing protein [Planctomycetales bacterium]